MEQKIRIEMNVEFTPTININDFSERFVSAVEKVVNDLAKESHTNVVSADVTLIIPNEDHEISKSVSNKNYDMYNNLDTQPIYYFDV